MTTKEVATETGIPISTITKYAREFNIKHYGEGRRKIYDWSKKDIERLKESVKLVGRPTVKNPVRPRKTTRKQ
jgi:DNA-binding transcriptional MerR regulator